MNIETWKKTDRLLHIMKLFEENKQRRWRIKEIADLLGINEDTAAKYLYELRSSGLLPIRDERHEWFLPEGAIIPKLEVSLSYPEVASLYLSGRMLAQIQDEQNWHISMGLKKLIDALPPSLKEQHNMLSELLLFVDGEDDDEPQRDLSYIFQVITCGWITRRRVRLTYLTARLREFECFFDPYLLEPSAIGRTIYAIGFSSIAKDVRTYKLERIQKAELTNETFAAPSFNAVKKLQNAWGVMYGDDDQLVQVRLRFSDRVTRRVRETRWHPSQKIKPTDNGCEWTAMIGDTLEIESWIRGWGGDCEVIEPAALRESMLHHLRRSMRVYGLTPPTTHDPKKFDRNLFRKE